MLINGYNFSFPKNCFILPTKINIVYFLKYKKSLKTYYMSSIKVPDMNYIVNKTNT